MKTKLPSLLASAFVLALSGGGCAAFRHLRPLPSDARAHVFSVRNVAAGDALEEAAAKAENEAGVHRADVDLVHAEIKVWTRGELDDDSLARALTAAGFDAVPGAGHGSYRPPAGYPARADARILTGTGEDIERLAVHVVPGKVTIFDFYADWCQPCRALDEQLVSLLATHDDVALRKVNIVDFQKPVARRWVGNAIPLLLIFDRAGKPSARLLGLDTKRLTAALLLAGLGRPRAPRLAEAPPAGARLVSPSIGAAQRLADPGDDRYKPVVPREHYRAGERYRGLFKVCVSEGGDVTYVGTIAGTGVADLDARWQLTIATWPHRPLRVDGATVPFCYPLKIEVQMEGPPPSIKP